MFKTRKMQKKFIEKIMCRNKDSNYLIIKCMSKVKKQSLEYSQIGPLYTGGSDDLKTIQNNFAADIRNTIQFQISMKLLPSIMKTCEL